MHTAGAFARGASRYHDVRPGYPHEVARLCGRARLVAEVGAGTGKFTESLLNCGYRVVASDPSPDMTRVLSSWAPVPILRATAEAAALADASVDAVACAQTWHWVTVPAACTEFDRIVAPGGRVVLAWNTLDVADPWVLRLARIMHSGDILREGFSPEVARPWHIAQEVRLRWTQTMQARDLFALAATRSFWLRASPAARNRLKENLSWYLFEHTALGPDDPVVLPYRTDAFALER